MKLEAGTVYFVHSDKDDTVLLALDAKKTDNGVEWFDTVRDRGFQPVKYEERDDAIRFETERARYELRKLTISIYNAQVRPKVEGQKTFRSTEDVQEFYRNYPR